MTFYNFTLGGSVAFTSGTRTSAPPSAEYQIANKSDALASHDSDSNVIAEHAKVTPEAGVVPESYQASNPPGTLECPEDVVPAALTPTLQPRKKLSVQVFP